MPTYIRDFDGDLTQCIHFGYGDILIGLARDKNKSYCDEVILFEGDEGEIGK